MLFTDMDSGLVVFKKDDGKIGVAHMFCKTEDSRTGKKKTLYNSPFSTNKHGEPTKCSTCDLECTDQIKIMVKLAGLDLKG